MTINNALGRCAEILGDSVPRETLMLWLSEIENTVLREIAGTHEGVMMPESSDALSDAESELFVPDPFSELYVLFAVMKNDLRLRDVQRYLNSAAVFSASYSSFADWFNRTHLPKGEKIKI